jgi:hypothetical protein
VVIGPFMIGILVCVYFISKNAGVAEAKKDQIGPTRLYPATFSLKACVERRDAKRAEARGVNSKTTQTEKNTEPEHCAYSGQILISRNGIYYMYKVAPIPEEPQTTLALHAYRAEELVNLIIAGQPPQ